MNELAISRGGNKEKMSLKGGAFGSREACVKSDFQGLLSFDRLQARITSTETRSIRELMPISAFLLLIRSPCYLASAVETEPEVTLATIASNVSPTINVGNYSAVPVVWRSRFGNGSFLILAHSAATPSDSRGTTVGFP